MATVNKYPDPHSEARTSSSIWASYTCCDLTIQHVQRNQESVSDEACPNVKTERC